MWGAYIIKCSTLSFSNKNNKITEKFPRRAWVEWVVCARKRMSGKGKVWVPLEMESNKHQFFILFSVCTAAVFLPLIPPSLFQIFHSPYLCWGEWFFDCGINGGLAWIKVWKIEEIPLSRKKAESLLLKTYFWDSKDVYIQINFGLWGFSKLEKGKENMLRHANCNILRCRKKNSFLLALRKKMFVEEADEG